MSSSWPPPATFSMSGSQRGLDSIVKSIRENEQELMIAKLLLAHLVHAQGGVFTIHSDELVATADKFELEIMHTKDPDMLRIKVELKGD